VFDSDLQGDDHTSFVATDNQAAGKIAGGRDDGRRSVARATSSSFATKKGQRAPRIAKRAFLDAVKDKTDLKIISDNPIRGATTETAFQKSESLLIATKRKTGAVNGVFTAERVDDVRNAQALKKSGTNAKVS